MIDKLTEQEKQDLPKCWHRIAFNGYHVGFITTKIVPKAYGYIIHRFSNYVAIQHIKYTILNCGLSKAYIMTDINHQPKRYSTMYFDRDKNEIDRKEFYQLLKDSLHSKI